ncbi:MAG: hypothetical protein JRC90_09445 [Deltaproteobacteria bacterium]|nr:hypothetical protein [Deltaproteobacteria bacterium]
MKKKAHSNDNTGKTIQICSIKFTLRPPEGIVAVSPPKNDKNNVGIQMPSFNMIGQNFITVLQMLWKYMHGIGAVAEKTSIRNLASLPVLLQDLVEREKRATNNETSIAEVEFGITIRDENKVEETKTITAKVYEPDHLKSLDEFRQYNDAALKILNESALQQIVNAYENVLCELLTWHFHNKPDSAPKNKEITYQKLLSFSSLEDAKKYVIDEEIENFLKRKGTDEQLKYIKEELKADIASHFKYISEFKEIILRRHAIVHAGGLASAEYIRRVKSIKGIDISNIDEGKLIPLNSKYVIDAWNIVCSMGVILLHLVAKACARSKHSKEEENEADVFLINSSCNCIQNNQLDAAESILNYAHKLKLSDDSSDWMVIINLAQTLRWKGDIEGCERLLNSKKWDAHNSLFQLCVAALRDDEETFKKLLFEIPSQEKISITELYEWPVFRLMRSKEDFHEWVKKAFGEEIKLVADLFKPKVIDIKSDDTLGALIDFLQKDSLSLDTKPSLEGNIGH